ncbi:MAG: hypothetical protein AB1724_14400 [Thermodesulfobacteriota bacterium]
MRRYVVFALILLPLLVSANPQHSAVKETVVSLGHGISGEEIYVNSLKISSNLKHISYVSRIGKTFRVWLDGVSNKTHDGVTEQSPFFSPQNNRLAYIAQENAKMFVVIDDQEHARYKFVGTITFSPDGSRLAYRVENENKKQQVVVDGQPGPLFDWGITKEVGIIFSPDSQHMAYVGINDNSSFVLVKDNKKMSSYEKIENVIFSPDSRHIAYKAMEKGKWFVVLDDKKGAAYNEINDLLFSPDGSQLVYSAMKNNRRLIVKNNEEISEGSGTLAPSFSPDGRRFAYLAVEKDNKFCYVVDGKKELSMDVPGRLLFSSDGTSAAYAAGIEGKWHIIKDGIRGPAFKEIEAFTYAKATNNILYAVKNEDGKYSVIKDETAGKFYHAIGTPLFSPDGKQYAYAAMQQGSTDMFMVINNVEQPSRYPVIGIPAEEKPGKFGFAFQQPYFSPKGSRMVFPVYDPDKKTAYMVVDGKPHPSFESIMQPIFSDDEKHVAYMARKDGRWRMVVDGEAGINAFDGIIRGSIIAFDARERCFFILVASQKESGLSFFRLEAKINEPS